MPNMILYEPQEGTTGFWGLRGVPEYPEVGCNQKAISEYEAALESCKEKKLEIVNPDECFTYGPYARNGSNEVIKFKEGEIFDLPIGYEFKSYKKCQHNGIHNSTCIYHEVLRLVKTETTEKQMVIEMCGGKIENNGYCSRCGYWSGQTSAFCSRISNPIDIKICEFKPQPEPEESQTWTDIYNLGQEHGVRNYIAILSSEIEKKKQSIVNDLGRNDYAMYNGGYSQALKEISELLDSLTPKK